MKNYLGIDIGGTNVKYALVDEAGKIIENDKISTAQNKEDFLNNLDQVVKKYQDKIQGIAFCAPGKITDTTIHYGGSLPFLDGIDLGERYKYLNIPVAGVNDGKASVLAENWLGSLKGLKNCAALTLGTGVGGGIIVNGDLVIGENSQAGEASMLILNTEKNGMDSFAGAQGSAVGMISKVNEALGNKDKTDGLAAFKAINAGDEKALKIFNQYCKNVAAIIINIQGLLDPKRIAIGGGISAQPIVIEQIKKEYAKIIESNVFMRGTLTPIEIVAAKFQNEANIYGALYNLLQNN